MAFVTFSNAWSHWFEIHIWSSCNASLSIEFQYTKTTQKTKLNRHQHGKSYLYLEVFEIKIVGKFEIYSVRDVIIIKFEIICTLYSMWWIPCFLFS